MATTSSTRAPAPFLPPELIHDILFPTSRATLLAASLVCRSWRDPAQALLEARLSLPTSKVARAWLACPGRKTRTRRLSLGAGLSIEECWAVFEGCEGLEELALLPDPARARAKFDLRALQCPQLKNLRTLHLAAPFHDLAPAVPWPLPFSLETLTCKGLYSSYPRPILAGIVASSRWTLATLDLDCYGSNTSARAFISAFRPITGVLRSMEIHGADRQVTPLLPFLSACTALTDFACWEATLPLLSALPRSLETLSVGKTFFHSDAPYADLLSRSALLDRDAGSRVKSIRWGGISRATLRAQYGGGDLLAECGDKGIKVEFGVEAAATRYGAYGWPMTAGKAAWQ
ncbi:hypothetical protein JCM10450v2_002409 [Rhodotorula kratochvilovae]